MKKITGKLMIPPYEGWGNAAPLKCEHDAMFYADHGMLFQEPVKGNPFDGSPLTVKLSIKKGPFTAYAVHRGKLIERGEDGSETYTAHIEA